MFTKGAEMILRDHEGALLSDVLPQDRTSSSSFTCLLQRRVVQPTYLLKSEERYFEAAGSKKEWPKNSRVGKNSVVCYFNALQK